MLKDLYEAIRKDAAPTTLKLDGGKMQYLLAEADGGAWRGEAMKNIKAFMEKAVQGLNVIA